MGLWSTNSCVPASYVAVVSSPRTNVPWPSSVWAYVPIIERLLVLSTHSACCSSVP